VLQLTQGVVQRPELVASLDLDRNEYGPFLFRNYVNQAG
jgi:hypothetical protein